MERVETDFVVSLFEQSKTYQEISIILQNMNPGQRGFSVTSVKRYCKHHGLSPRINQGTVDQMVSDCSGRG